LFCSLFFFFLDLKLAAEVGKTLLENNALLEDQQRWLQDQVYNNQCSSDEKRYQTMIDKLEQEHAELLDNYQTIVESNNNMKKRHKESEQKLMAQADALYKELEEAYDAIQKHEEERCSYQGSIQKLKMQQKEMMSKQNSAEIDRLSAEVSQLTARNQALLQAKEETKRRFEEIVNQFEQAKRQLTQMGKIKEQYDILHKTFQHQTTHITQLKTWIKECQHESNKILQVPELMSDSLKSYSSSDEDDSDHNEQMIQLHTHDLVSSSLFSELQSAMQTKNIDFTTDDVATTTTTTTAIAAFTDAPIVVRDVSDAMSLKAYNLYPQIQKRHSTWSCRVNVGGKRKRAYSSTVLCKPTMKRRIFSIARLPLDICYLIWRFTRFVLVAQLSLFFVLLFSFNK
jgi:myosin heavy subunit